MTTNRMDGLMAQEETDFVGGISPAIQTLESIISEIAPTSIPVLLVGESGTGKEMFANRVHQLSARCEQPLKRITCAAMTPAAFSAELARITEGKNEAGTVFFDEVSELDSICQRALLCALPDGNAGPRSGMLKA